MARLLRILAWAIGLACVAIGIFHFSLGIASVPGEAHAGATVDSRERFYGAIFLGYGAVWLWAVRQPVIPSGWVRGLAAVFWLGGAGRLLSIAVHGMPNWFQTVLTVIKVVLPPLLLWLVSASGNTLQVATGSRERSTSGST